MRADGIDRSRYVTDRDCENDDIASGNRGDVRSDGASIQARIDERPDRVEDVERKVTVKVLGKQSAESTKSYDSDRRD